MYFGTMIEFYTINNYKMLKKIGYFLLISTVVIACSKNTITGRSQLKLLPESQLQAMATEQYQQFLSTNKVVSPSANRDATK